MWAGTYPVNITSNGLIVDKTDFSARHGYPIDVPASEPILQTKLYTGMQDTLCGMRSAQSYQEAVKDARIATKNSNGKYECPSGLTACSDNQAVDGVTYCIDQAKDEECPITELRLFDADSFEASELKDDPDW